MKKIKISFSDFWGGWEDNNNFWTIILNKLNIPYEIVSDNSDLLISSSFGGQWLSKKSKKKIYWTGENWFRMDSPVQQLNNMRIIDFFDMVYSFDYNTHKNHYRFPLYLIDCMEKNITDFNSFIRIKSKDQLYTEFKDRGFCTFVQGNGNSVFRNNYFNSLSNIEKVDSFGTLFNNTGVKVDRLGKIEKTRSYKFALAFENSESDGYVSEKIIDAFESDIIPIYWGGTKVSSDFNSKSFIDVNQLGVDKSLEIIRDINKDFDKYWEYYNQKIVSEDQKSLSTRLSDFEENFKNVINSI